LCRENIFGGKKEIRENKIKEFNQRPIIYGRIFTRGTAKPPRREPIDVNFLK